MSDQSFNCALQVSRPVAGKEHVILAHEGGMCGPVDEHGQWSSSGGVDAGHRQISIARGEAASVAVAVRDGNDGRACKDGGEVLAGEAHDLGQLVGGMVVEFLVEETNKAVL